MAKHSRVGASSSERWLECPGSVLLSERAPIQAPSVYAEEGTAAHSLAEICLTGGEDAIEHLGEIISTETRQFEVDEEMAEHVQMYLDVVRADWLKFPDFFGTETRIHLGWIHEDMFGTSDSHCGKKKKKLIVHDLKYGAGVPVEAEKNKQGLYYILGVASIYDFDFEEYEFVIVQPRAFHHKGPIRRWSFSLEELKAFERELKIGFDRVIKAREVEDLTTFLKPGDHCRWCPAAIDCPALQRKMELSVFEDFDPISDDILSVTPTPPEKLGMKKLAAALEFSSILEAWINQVRSYAYQIAQEGNPPPGFKLVQKYGRKKVKDEDQLKEVLLSLGFSETDFLQPPSPPKMKGITQLKKLFKKKDGWDLKFLRHFVAAPETGAVLVPENDERKALENSVEDDFTVVTD